MRQRHVAGVMMLGLLASAGGAAPWGQGPTAPAAGAAQAGSPAEETWESRAARFGGDEWITRANRDVAMGFTISLELQEVLVRPGQTVKAGQLLMRARDGEILAGLALQRQKAANRTEIQNAKAQEELAQSRFDAVKKVMDKDAGTTAEFDERRIALDSAKIVVDAAEKKLEEQQLEYVRLQEQASRYRIEAPFDGYIDTLAAEVGQTVTERDPIIRIVQVDPLWVDVPVRTGDTIRQKLGADHPAWALLDLPGEPVVLKGRVLYVSSVVDSSSGTRRVRVEVANPERWPSGTRARVRFTDPGVEWTRRASASAAGGGASGGTAEAPASAAAAPLAGAGGGER